MRVVILGPPRTGKSTYATALAKKLGIPIVSTGKPAEGCLLRTDMLISLGWEKIPNAVIRILEHQDSFILEGCQAARVLRRWYRDDAKAPRLDRVIILTKPFVQRSSGQEAMSKGIETILAGLLPTLKRNHVRVVTNPTDEDQ